MKLPTVRIKKGDMIVIINRKDYDPDLHILAPENKGSKKKTGKYNKSINVNLDLN